MAGEARQRLAHLLGELDARGSFSARTTAPPDDLQVDVRGVGRLILPVSDDQARALCKIARPARYGQREQTLLDRRVRDTWEVPRSRVRIDGRRWRRTLQPVLEALRDDLGLPSTSRLQAQLHSFLVYARGQFFLPHQDSEKDDEMVATLVVTLPSRFTGGSLVVAHEGRRASYRGSKAALSFVAFYADCRHEVKPVTSGHRIVLTYNLLLRQDSDAADLPDAPPEAVHALEALLAEHFSAPAPGWRENPHGDPPSRLVYLLDHEYTERGLEWERLKGHDVGRASTLRRAAVDADCDAVLGLAQVHETWSTTPFDDRWYGRGRRSWHEDDDDDYGELAGEDEYELDELIEQTVELQCWLREPGAARPVRISLSISDHEVSATTPSHALTPYESQYEGYMGNYGNTIDRWYRRAAVVLWPKAMAFAVRAQADPAWALSQISRRLRASDTAVAQELVASLEPFWATAARAVQSPRFVGAALRVAGSLDDGELARMLLAPLQIEALAPGHAAALAGFVQRHGERLLAGLLETWAQRPRWHAGPADRAGWVTALPRLCEALVTRGSSGEAAGVALVTASLHWLTAAMRGALGDRAPSRRSQALGELAGPLTAVLHSAALLGAVKLRDEAIGFCTAQGDELVPCLVQALRAGAALARQMRRDSGLDQLADHCLGRLAVILDRPPRAGGDWSMQPPGDCGCELCAVLSKFLSDRTERTLEWPLAEQRRRHVHTIIDAAELPVSHRTRRQGRPYTLVLTKTDALHETERRERAARRADARWLVAHTVQDTAPSDSLVLH